MLDSAASAAPAGDRDHGIQLRQQDGGWYLSAGGQQQGPFLYRPIFVQEWEREPDIPDATDQRTVAHYTQFDAAGKQITFLQEYQVPPTGDRTLMQTSVVEDPPSPAAYEGLENPEPQTST